MPRLIVLIRCTRVQLNSSIWRFSFAGANMITIIGVFKHLKIPTQYRALRHFVLEFFRCPITCIEPKHTAPAQCPEAIQLHVQYDRIASWETSEYGLIDILISWCSPSCQCRVRLTHCDAVWRTSLSSMNGDWNYSVFGNAEYMHVFNSVVALCFFILSLRRSF